MWQESNIYTLEVVCTVAERQNISISGILAEYSLKQLTKDAELIVEAHVSKAAVSCALVQIGPNKFPLAFTDNQIRIENALKSSSSLAAGSSVLVRTLGGASPDFDVSVDNEA